MSESSEISMAADFFSFSLILFDGFLGGDVVLDVVFVVMLSDAVADGDDVFVFVVVAVVVDAGDLGDLGDFVLLSTDDDVCFRADVTRFWLKLRVKIIRFKFEKLNRTNISYTSLVLSL